MHCSRMRTVRCSGRRRGGGVSQHALGFSALGRGEGCLPVGGGSAQGVFAWGVSARWGVSALGVSTQGVSA